MATIDPTQILGDMLGAANASLNADLTTMGGYAEAKAQAIANQASMIGTYYASGQITEVEAQHFLDGLQDMVTSFVNTVEGLALIDVEKAWNAMIGVLWDAIGSATGGALTLTKPVMP